MTRRANPQTREKLLDAAEALMLRRGYAATTVEDICSRSRLTKGSFFHYFHTKNEIAVAALQRFYSRTRSMFGSAPFRRHRDPLRRVYGYLDFLSDLSRKPGPRGCLLGVMAQELADTDEAVRTACSECFRDWSADLRRDLDLARARYAPRARWNGRTLADHCIAVVEGALILVKSTQDGAVLRESLAHLKRYLQYVFEGKAAS